MRVENGLCVTRFLAAALCILAVGCGGDSTGPESRTPAKIEAVSGATATGTVGTTLTPPLTVRVTSASGKPVSGSLVTFRVTAGTGSVSPSTDTTNSAGEAQASFTIGVTAGSNEVTASVTGLATTQRFSITGTPSTLSRVVNAVRNAKMYSLGDTVRLRASAEDQFGNPVPTTVQWLSRNEAAVSVDGSGLVRALQRDVSTYVVATAGGQSDSTRIEVLQSPCTGASAPVSLAVGQVVTGSAMTSLCITGIAGAEFAAIAFNTASVPSANVSFELIGAGLAAPPVASVSALAQPVATNLVRASGEAAIVPALQPDESFEKAFRERERVQLTPLVSGAQAWYQSRRTSGALRNVIPSSVRVGDVVSLNVEGTSGCSAGSAKIRGARVAAISNGAVILSDTANPAGGFTDAEYQSIATQFDTLVTPVDTAAFGAPTDIDGNGKVILIYTRTVNELTARGSASYVGGLTASRDLFPTSSTSGFSGCAASNVGEMFYMLVPDSTGAVNGNTRTKSFVLQVTVGTIAHEYQHLINAARRLYVLRQGGISWQEELWLNEGLSHIAEELVYYRSSRNDPRSNLTPTTIRGSQAQVDAFNSFQLANWSRYRSFLNAVTASSPYANNDELSTRGATWNFLRYAADRLGSTDGTLWNRLVNGSTTGMSNLQSAFGVDQAGLTELFRDWATSVYTDDLVNGISANYAQPSWNWRSLFQGLFAQPIAFPVVGGSLTDATAAPATLMGGAAAVSRFSVLSSVDALVRVTGPAGGTLLGPVTLSVVRLK